MAEIGGFRDNYNSPLNPANKNTNTDTSSYSKQIANAIWNRSKVMAKTLGEAGLWVLDQLNRPLAFTVGTFEGFGKYIGETASSMVEWLSIPSMMDLQNNLNNLRNKGLSEDKLKEILQTKWESTAPFGADIKEALTSLPFVTAVKRFWQNPSLTEIIQQHRDNDPYHKSLSDDYQNNYLKVKQFLDSIKDLPQEEKQKKIEELRQQGGFDVINKNLLDTIFETLQSKEGDWLVSFLGGGIAGLILDPLNYGFGLFQKTGKKLVTSSPTLLDALATGERKFIGDVKDFAEMVDFPGELKKIYDGIFGEYKIVKDALNDIVKKTAEFLRTQQSPDNNFWLKLKNNITNKIPNEFWDFVDDMKKMLTNRTSDERYNKVIEITLKNEHVKINKGLNTFLKVSLINSPLLNLKKANVINNKSYFETLTYENLMQFSKNFLPDIDLKFNKLELTDFLIHQLYQMNIFPISKSEAHILIPQMVKFGVDTLIIDGKNLLHNIRKYINVLNIVAKPKVHKKHYDYNDYIYYIPIKNIINYAFDITPTYTRFVKNLFTEDTLHILEKYKMDAEKFVKQITHLYRNVVEQKLRSDVNFNVADVKTFIDNPQQYLTEIKNYYLNTKYIKYIAKYVSIIEDLLNSGKPILNNDDASINLSIAFGMGSMAYRRSFIQDLLNNGLLKFLPDENTPEDMVRLTENGLGDFATHKSIYKIVSDRLGKVYGYEETSPIVKTYRGALNIWKKSVLTGLFGEGYGYAVRNLTSDVLKNLQAGVDTSKTALSVIAYQFSKLIDKISPDLGNKIKNLTSDVVKILTGDVPSDEKMIKYYKEAVENSLLDVGLTSDIDDIAKYQQGRIHILPLFEATRDKEKNKTLQSLFLLTKNKENSNLNYILNDITQALTLPAKEAKRKIENLIKKIGALKDMDKNNTHGWITDLTDILNRLSQNIKDKYDIPISTSFAGKTYNFIMSLDTLGAQQFAKLSENASKLAFYSELRKRGYSVEDAVRATNKYTFNYNDIDDKIRDLRQIIPFITFYLKNIMLQFEGLISEPRSLNMLRNGLTFLIEYDDDDKTYVEKRNILLNKHIPLIGGTGLAQYVAQFNQPITSVQVKDDEINAIHNIYNALSGFITALHPVLKLGFELSVNKEVPGSATTPYGTSGGTNTYTGGPIVRYEGEPAQHLPFVSRRVEHIVFTLVPVIRKGATLLSTAKDDLTQPNPDYKFFKNLLRYTTGLKYKEEDDPYKAYTKEKYDARQYMIDITRLATIKKNLMKAYSRGKITHDHYQNEINIINNLIREIRQTKYKREQLKQEDINMMKELEEKYFNFLDNEPSGFMQFLNNGNQTGFLEFLNDENTKTGLLDMPKGDDTMISSLTNIDYRDKVTNYSERTAPIRKIIIHRTGSDKADLKSVLSWFSNPKSQVSAHYMITKDGKIVSFVDEDKRAWHTRGQNNDSIGIELEGKTGVKWEDIPVKQKQALVALIRDIYSRRGVLPIYTHADFDPSRRSDDPFIPTAKAEALKKLNDLLKRGA